MTKQEKKEIIKCLKLFKKHWLNIIKKKWVKFFLGFIFIIAFHLPFIIFGYNFRTLPFSDKPNDWAIFGTYIGGMYTFISFLILSFLTYIAIQINTKVANNQIKQNIYNAYFEQINYLFFDVIKQYRDYEKKIDQATEEGLRNSLETYQIFIDNLKSETKSFEKSDVLEEMILECSNQCETFKNDFVNVGNENRDNYLKDFIQIKSKLIRTINDNIKI